MPGGEFLAMEGPLSADGERFIVLLHKVLHTCEGTVPWAVKFAEVASKMVPRCTKAGQGNLGKHDICGTYPRTVRSDSYLSGRQSKEKQTRWAHCKATARPRPTHSPKPQRICAGGGRGMVSQSLTHILLYLDGTLND